MAKTTVRDGHYERNLINPVGRPVYDFRFFSSSCISGLTLSSSLTISSTSIHHQVHNIEWSQRSRLRMAIYNKLGLHACPCGLRTLKRFELIRLAEPLLSTSWTCSSSTSPRSLPVFLISISAFITHTRSSSLPADQSCMHHLIITHIISISSILHSYFFIKYL